MIGGTLVDAARLSPLLLATTLIVFGAPLALLALAVMTPRANGPLVILGLLLLQVVLSGLMTTGLLAAVQPATWRRRAGPMERFSIALKAWPMATAYNLLSLAIYGLSAVLGMLLALVGLAVTHQPVTSSTGTVAIWCGVAGGVLPAMIFLTRWVAGAPLAVTDQPDFAANLARSAALTRGQRGAVFVVQASVPVAWAASVGLVIAMPDQRISHALPLPLPRVLLFGLIGLTTALYALAMGRLLRELNELDTAGSEADLAAMFE